MDSQSCFVMKKRLWTSVDALRTDTFRAYLDASKI